MPQIYVSTGITVLQTRSDWQSVTALWVIRRLTMQLDIYAQYLEQVTRFYKTSARKYWLAS